MDSSAAPPGPAEGGAAAPTGGEPTPPRTDPAPARREPEEGPVIAITGLADTIVSDAGASDAGAVEPGAAPDAGQQPGTEPQPGAPAAGDDVEADLAARAPAPAHPGGSWSPSLLFMTVSALIVAALDLGTKEWAKLALAGPDLKRTSKRIEVIPDHLDFIFAQNPGGAWSFLRGMPDGLRRPFFLFVSAAAIVFIVSVYRRLDPRQWAMRWGLPLALGGAIGNLTDRVRYGWVVDFIDFYWKGKANEMHWPTFNVADVAIVFGVGLMAIDLFSLRRMKAPHPAQASATTASGAA